jgi:hypothetical protein
MGPKGISHIIQQYAVPDIQAILALFQREIVLVTDLPLKKALEFSVLPSISASYKNRAWPQCGH